MSITPLEISEFQKFFSGSKYNYNNLYYDDADFPEGAKVLGRYSAVSGKILTIEQYKDHLEGRIGLGIVPLDENNNCNFGVIDIDLYKYDMQLYIEAIEKHNFPLVVFRSKSGGLHIYLFLDSPVSAKSIKSIMKKYSVVLALDILCKQVKNKQVEIFPLQDKIGEGANTHGSAVNLPYFNIEHGKNVMIREGKELSLHEALSWIKRKRTTLKDAMIFLEDLMYNDAPPCLQTLYFLNPFGENSNRNHFLFSFGVYLKKKNEDTFELDLLTLNRYIRAPIEEKELDSTVISSLRRKDYIYKCKESPCCDFCSKSICRKREYGIGKDNGFFSTIELGKLFQIRTAQPYYEWEVRVQGQEVFKKMRFKTEEEIIKQDTFLKLCMRELHELPTKLKQSEWFNRVNTALKEIEIIDVSEEMDTSPIIMLRSLVLEFLTNRALATKREQLLAGRVFFDDKENMYFFRMQDLANFIFNQKQLKGYTSTELHPIMQNDFGVIKKKFNYYTANKERKQCWAAALNKSFVEKYGDAEDNPDFSEFEQPDF